MTCSDQLFSVPVLRLVPSLTSSVHVPLASWPLRADSGFAGRNEPLNGELAVVIDCEAESSNVVLANALDWEPPTICGTRTTRVPAGVNVCATPVACNTLLTTRMRSLMFGPTV